MTSHLNFMTSHIPKSERMRKAVIVFVSRAKRSPRGAILSNGVEGGVPLRKSGAEFEEPIAGKGRPQQHGNGVEMETPPDPPIACHAQRDDIGQRARQQTKAAHVNRPCEQDRRRDIVE